MKKPPTFSLLDFRIAMGSDSFVYLIFLPPGAGVFIAITLCLHYHCVLVYETDNHSFRATDLQTERNFTQKMCLGDISKSLLHTWILFR